MYLSIPVLIFVAYIFYSLGKEAGRKEGYAACDCDDDEED